MVMSGPNRVDFLKQIRVQREACAQARSEVERSHQVLAQIHDVIAEAWSLVATSRSLLKPRP